MRHFYLFQTDVSTLFQTTPAQKQSWRVLKLCWGLNSFFFFPFLLSYITFWVTAAIQLWPIQDQDWVLLISGEIQLTLRCPHIYSALFIIAMKWTPVPAKSQKSLAGFFITLPWFNLREQTSWGARERCLSSWPQASVRQKKSSLWCGKQAGGRCERAGVWLSVLWHHPEGQQTCSSFALLTSTSQSVHRTRISLGRSVSGGNMWQGHKRRFGNRRNLKSFTECGNSKKKVEGRDLRGWPTALCWDTLPRTWAPHGVKTCHLSRSYFSNIYVCLQMFWPSLQCASAEKSRPGQNKGYDIECMRLWEKLPAAGVRGDLVGLKSGSDLSPPPVSNLLSVQRKDGAPQVLP